MHVCVSLCTTVIDHTAQNSSDHLSSYPLDNHYSSDDVYWRGNCDLDVWLLPATQLPSLVLCQLTATTLILLHTLTFLCQLYMIVQDSAQIFWSEMYPHSILDARTASKHWQPQNSSNCSRIIWTVKEEKQRDLNGSITTTSNDDIIVACKTPDCWANELTSSLWLWRHYTITYNHTHTHTRMHAHTHTCTHAHTRTIYDADTPSQSTVTYNLQHWQLMTNNANTNLRSLSQHEMMSAQSQLTHRWQTSLSMCDVATHTTVPLLAGDDARQSTSGTG